MIYIVEPYQAQKQQLTRWTGRVWSKNLAVERLAAERSEQRTLPAPQASSTDTAAVEALCTID